MAGPTSDLASRFNARRRALGIGTSYLARQMDMSRANVNSLMSERGPRPRAVVLLTSEVAFRVSSMGVLVGILFTLIGLEIRRVELDVVKNE